MLHRTCEWNVHPGHYPIPPLLATKFRRFLDAAIGGDRQTIYRIRNAFERLYLKRMEQISYSESQKNDLLREIKSIDLLRYNIETLPGIGKSWAEKWCEFLSRYEAGYKPPSGLLGLEGGAEWIDLKMLRRGKKVKNKG
jgi:hypothetical protein